MGKNIAPLAVMFTALATLAVAVSAWVNTCQTRHVVDIMEKNLRAEKGPVLNLDFEYFEGELDPATIVPERDNRISIYHNAGTNMHSGIKVFITNSQSSPSGYANDVRVKYEFCFKRFDTKKDVVCDKEIPFGFIKPGGDDEKAFIFDKMEYCRLEFKSIEYSGMFSESEEQEIVSRYKVFQYDRGKWQLK